MADISMRDELIARIRAMSDEQVARLSHVVQEIESSQLPTNYDPARDPAIGFIENAPPDYSERAKEILRADIDSQSGWTQKDKLP